MCDKNLNLLRQFDPTIHPIGTLLVFAISGQLQAGIGKFIAGPDAQRKFVIDWDDDRQNGLTIYRHDGNTNTSLKLAPLCWVEGRPVYAGDTLWSIRHNSSMTVTRFDSWMLWGTEPGQLPGTTCSMHPENVSWVRPKTKVEGWINIYRPSFPDAAFNTSHAWPSRGKADQMRGKDHGASGKPEWVDCIRVEYELPTTWFTSTSSSRSAST